MWKNFRGVGGFVLGLCLGLFLCWVWFVALSMLAKVTFYVVESDFLVLCVYV